MMGSKGQEVEALAASIDEKMKLAGEIAVEDLTDTEASLLKDKEFLKNLESSCKMKTKEWETLPSGSASLVQMQQSRAALREKALRVVRGAWQVSDVHDCPGLDFLVLVLTGKNALNQGIFDKVVIKNV